MKEVSDFDRISTDEKLEHIKELMSDDKDNTKDNDSDDKDEWVFLDKKSAILYKIVTIL